MTTILDTIIASKRQEVAAEKSRRPVAELEKQPFFDRDTLSLRNALLDDTKTGIIAEFKRRSPSRGVINDRASVATVTTAYTAAGASGLSILTDTVFFGGSAGDLQEGRANSIPILRKDFVIDEYQLVEAKAIGADVILLIAACLSPAEVKNLARQARRLGLEVLLELHGEEELDHICDETELVGINNRNLKTFEVDLERSLRMAEKIPTGKIKIAESGIDDVAQVHLFRDHGFRGFLMGEAFMKTNDPGAAFKKFVLQLNPGN